MNCVASPRNNTDAVMSVAYEIYMELMHIRKGSRATGWAPQCLRNIVFSAPRVAANKLMDYDRPKYASASCWRFL